jgi:hypothetical protein
VVAFGAVNLVAVPGAHDRLAASPLVEGVTGRHFEDNIEAVPVAVESLEHGHEARPC